MNITEYHRSTAYERFSPGGRRLDWANQPAVHKVYPGRRAVALGRTTAMPDVSLWAFGQQEPCYDREPLIAPEILLRLLYLANGPTARRRIGGRDFFFRAAPSAGALYPNEIYMAAYRVEGLESGIYHCRAADMSVTPLRSGDFKSVVARQVCRPAAGGLAASFFISGIFFRSAWKYRERAYRYVLLDAGHILENLRMALEAERLEYSLHYDFDDVAVTGLLGLDPRHEQVVACLHFYGGPDTVGKREGRAGRLPATRIDAEPCAPCERVYQAIIAAHRAGLGIVPDAGVDADCMDGCMGAAERWIALPDYDPPSDSGGLSRAVGARRSRRNFIPATLSRDAFYALLDLVCRSALLRADKRSGWPLSAAVLTGAVEDRAPGLYVLDPTRRRFGQVPACGGTPEMAEACMDQRWLKHAALHFIFTADLEKLEEKFGPRGYRYAMLEAGRLGEAVYLGAAALGLGACGIGACYDTEAARLLGLPETAAMLYLTAAGPVKKIG